MEDASEPRTHRIEIRLTVPPCVSSLLPMHQVVRVLENRGVFILGVQARTEDESEPSSPSVIRGGPS